MSDLTENVVPIKISKLDAARRQLITAIRLYFENGDPVSIHTLAAAAFGILRHLDAHGPQTGTIIEHVKEYVLPEHRDKVVKVFYKAQNFFKHADKDPDGVLEYYPTAALVFLWSAIEKYYEITKEDSLEVSALRSWIFIRNPEILLPPYRQQVERIGLGRSFGPEMRKEFFESFAATYPRMSVQRSAE